MTTTNSARRAPPIKRVRATWRVPLGLMPVTAAIATIKTTMPSQASQVMPLQHTCLGVPAKHAGALEAVSVYGRVFIGSEDVPRRRATFLRSDSVRARRRAASGSRGAADLRGADTAQARNRVE
jgi:hypothetical protein